MPASLPSALSGFDPSAGLTRICKGLGSRLYSPDLKSIGPFPGGLRRQLARTAWLGLLGGLLWLNLYPPSVQAEVSVLKQGERLDLPLLQTRARPPVQRVEMLYLGMLEDRFLDYALENNWQTISVVRDQPGWVRWQLLPGGEAVYSPKTVDLFPIYARGFVVQAYFGQKRLVGLHLVRNPEEPGFEIEDLVHLIEAWFPDNRLLLRYQLLPDDPSQQVITAYLGTIPPAFISDVGRTPVPFCQAFFSPNAQLPLVPPAADLAPQCPAFEGQITEIDAALLDRRS